MADYFYEDAQGHVHVSRSATCLPGMKPSRGSLKDGKVLTVPMMMADGADVRPADIGMTDAQRELARAGLAAASAAARKRAEGSVTVDHVAGASHLLTDAGSMVLTDALSACPRDTRDLQGKVARAIGDAQSAVSDGAFQNAIGGLTSMARQYEARSFLAKDDGQKAVLKKASAAIAAYTDGLLVSRGKGISPIGDKASAYAGMNKRISDGWRGAA